jgi:hypothetical protein
MLELPAEIKSAFEKGEFSIRQTSGSFNGIEKNHHKKFHQTRRVGLYIKGVSHGSVKWFTNAWTCSSSRFKAVCFISSCEVLLVLVIPALSFIAQLNDASRYSKDIFSRS